VLRLRILLALLGVVITFASLYFSFQLLNPTPPRVVTMVTGPPGSAFARMGEMYRDILAESGVDVVLRPSKGAIDNLEILSSGRSDIGFLTMGTPDTVDARTLRSLGAMFYEPLWLFTRNPVSGQGDIETLVRGRISIGPPKSRSNAASRHLLELNGLDPDRLDLLELAPAEAARRLETGELDSLFIVSNALSPVITQLLVNPQVHLVDFERADAYVALHPELTKLVVPEGVGDLALNLPPKDKRVLAFTAILAVRENLHPITQSLFLDAASRIHGHPDFFHGFGSFPRETDQVILLSDSARAYYADGRPFLLRLLPYWIAVLVMQTVAAAIPLLGVVYPLLKLLPALFHFVMRRRFHMVYNELRRIDRNIGSADPRQLAADRARLEELEQRVTALRAPVTYSTNIYALKAHIASVLNRVRNAEEG